MIDVDLDWRGAESRDACTDLVGQIAVEKSNVYSGFANVPRNAVGALEEIAFNRGNPDIRIDGDVLRPRNPCGIEKPRRCRFRCKYCRANALQIQARCEHLHVLRHRLSGYQASDDMGNPIRVASRDLWHAWHTPRFEHLTDLSYALRIEPRKDGALKVVQSRWRIVIQEQTGDLKSNIGEPRPIADTMKRDCIRVIDDVGSVPCLASGPFEQWDGSRKIPVFQCLEGILIIHVCRSCWCGPRSASAIARCLKYNRALLAGLRSLSRFKVFFGPPFEASFLLCAIDAAFF